MTFARGRLLRAVGAVALLVGSIVVPSVAAAAPGSDQAGARSFFADPDASLGRDWSTSSDVLVTGVGDSTGFHLYVAREDEAFAWRTLATLTSSVVDTAMWTGEVCVTGSGKYAVAVFAPAEYANHLDTMKAGGLAAVVDVATGKATLVARDVQLAYFDPSCGSGDRALLTRAIGVNEQQTDLLTVDAAQAEVVDTRRVDAQLTTPVPASDGDYGIAHGTLVKVGPQGSLDDVADPTGQPFALVPTAHHGIDVASVSGKDAVVERFDGASRTTLARGPWNTVQLFRLAGGRDAIVGDGVTLQGSPPELTLLHSPGQVRAVSRDGHLLATEIVTGQAVAKGRHPLSRPPASAAGPVHLTVRATGSDQVSTGTITTGEAPTLNAALASGAVPTLRVASTAGVMGPLDDDDVYTPTCAVGRDDPNIQALQPSPNMVEWAVDMAVHGALNVQRPQDYLSTGQPAYTPQGMFPLEPLAGGGSVPAQVMLGILAQESNLDEASWHAVPGDAGNPLIADYYGNGNADNDLIEYGSSDCGYGIGQVTDNMRAGPSDFTREQQIAVATDYAANIAAALNILIQKWNQTIDGETVLNEGDPQWIENWFAAVWAYNSGFHPQAKASENYGQWGLGWLNNPMNPVYPANRNPFLRTDYGDASHPADWSYEEKVMGWAETPQRRGGLDSYGIPDYGDNFGAYLNLPSREQFCSDHNGCDPTASGDPCGNYADFCWWHGANSWVSCDENTCAREHLYYELGDPEPAIQRTYDRDCSTFTGAADEYWDSSKDTVVVYDLNDTDNYILGCSTAPTEGKFTLRRGYPPGVWPDAYYTEIDLHQLGAGYQGHVWFTHVYPSTYMNGTYNEKHQVTATWTPNLGLADGQSRRYDILAHLPSHGANYQEAEYSVFPDTGDTAIVIDHDDNGNPLGCVIHQGTATDSTGSSGGHDAWVYLGNYTLKRGTHVELNNIGDYAANGTVDIGFDAMAFVPIGSGAGHTCREKP